MTLIFANEHQTESTTFNQAMKGLLLGEHIDEDLYLKIVTGRLEKVALSWYDGLDPSKTGKLTEFVVYMKKFDKRMIF